MDTSYSGAVQVHLTYRFQRGPPLVADADLFTGGKTARLAASNNLHLQRNSRNRRHVLARARLPPGAPPVSRGAYTTIGVDPPSIARRAYNYAWAR